MDWIMLVIAYIFGAIVMFMTIWTLKKQKSKIVMFYCIKVIYYDLTRENY